MKASRPYLLLASNLHVGGGVQVAASLLDEVASLSMTARYSGIADLIHCEVSSKVLRNLRPTTAGELSIREVNRRPSHVQNIALDAWRKHDSVLTVFGPIFSLPRTRSRIMGFADVTSIYPDPVDSPISRSLRARNRVRSHLSRIEASKNDVLVVETPALRARLREVLGVRAPQIEVIANAVNARVLTAKADDAIAARMESERRQGADLLLSYPTRAYRHKNLNVIPAVAKELAVLGVHCRFIVTLRPDEWAAQTPDFRKATLNLGEVTVAQVGTVIRASDGVFFPSLLEAYSATPIEALALGVPLYASDRDFVRSLCGDAAVYFDPLDPADAAAAVHRHCADVRGASFRAGVASKLVAGLPNAQDRAAAFLDLLTFDSGASL